MKKNAASIVAVILFGIVLLGYGLTLAPGVLGGDAGELQFVPHILSLAHPTGYPLQTLLNKIWITLVPCGSVAWRTNLLSALLAAGGVTLVFLTIHRTTASIAGAVIGALALGHSPVYWGQAVLADKYALNGFLTALLFWCASHFYKRPDAHTLAILAFVGGLGLAHHRSFLVFGLPLTALLIGRGGRLLRQPRYLVAGCLALAGPLLLYLYVPWAAARALPPFHAQIRSWSEFAAFMLDAGYLGQVGFLPKGDNLYYFANTFVTNYGLAFLTLTACGLILQWLWSPSQRGWVALLLASFLFQSYLTQNYNVPRRFVFFIPAYVCAAILMGEGVSGWLKLAQWGSARFLSRIAVFGQTLVIAIFLSLTLSRLPGEWRSHWVEQRVSQPMDIWRQDLKTGGQADRLSKSLRLVHPRSLIVGDWEQATPLWYAQQVEGVCPDCLILSGMHRMTEYAARATSEGRPLYVARTLNQAAEWSKPTASGPLVFLSPIAETRLPDGLIPLAFTFDDRVQLVGYVWPLGQPALRPGTVLPISLIWRLADGPVGDYAISLRLIGSSGQVWQMDSTAPVLGMHPFSKLAAGQVIADYYEVPVPMEAREGDYRLQVILYHSLANGGFKNAWVTDDSGFNVGEAATVMQFSLPVRH